MHHVSALGHIYCGFVAAAAAAFLSLLRRNTLSMLVALAVAEPGENWDRETFKGSRSHVTSHATL